MIEKRENLIHCTRFIPLGAVLTLITSLTLFNCKGQNTTNTNARTSTTQSHADHASSGHTSSKSQKKTHDHEDKENHGHGMAKLPVEKRVAFMSGHIAAGLALYRAGAPDQAAQHLLHPVSETHKAERAGIDALGFTPEVFQAVSKALDDNRPAAEIEPMLKKAEANIILLQKNAKGDPADIIEYLMKTIDEEYAVGVKNGVITDPGEYQDAFGFSVVALNTARRIPGSKAKATIAQLETLVSLWPENGPLAKSTPKPVKLILDQTAQVIKTLSALR